MLSVTFCCTWNKPKAQGPVSSNPYLGLQPLTWAILLSDYSLSLNSPASSQLLSISFPLSLILSCLCLQLMCCLLRAIPFYHFPKKGFASVILSGFTCFLFIFSTKTEAAWRPVPYILLAISSVPDTVTGSQYIPDEYLLISLIYGAIFYDNFNSIIKLIINISFLDHFWK